MPFFGNTVRYRLIDVAQYSQSIEQVLKNIATALERPSTYRPRSYCKILNVFRILRRADLRPGLPLESARYWVILQTILDSVCSPRDEWHQPNILVLQHIEQYWRIGHGRHRTQYEQNIRRYRKGANDTILGGKRPFFQTDAVCRPPPARSQQKISRAQTVPAWQARASIPTHKRTTLTRRIGFFNVHFVLFTRGETSHAVRTPYRPYMHRSSKAAEGVLRGGEGVGDRVAVGVRGVMGEGALCLRGQHTCCEGFG